MWLLIFQGRIIMSNKFARVFAFFYTLLLHCLVFLVWESLLKVCVWHCFVFQHANLYLQCMFDVALCFISYVCTVSYLWFVDVNYVLSPPETDLFLILWKFLFNSTVSNPYILFSRCCTNLPTQSPANETWQQSATRGGDQLLILSSVPSFQGNSNAGSWKCTRKWNLTLQYLDWYISIQYTVL